MQAIASFRTARLIFSVLLALGLSACFKFVVSEKIFVRPTPDQSIGVGHTPAAKGWQLPVGYSAKALVLPREEPTRLHGVWISASASNAADRITVLHFMGNGSRISQNGSEIAKALLPFGVDLVLFDHRGSGQSSGQPTFALLREDAVAIYDYLLNELKIPKKQVVVHGFSLGSLIAGDLATHRPLAALILDGTGSTPEQYVKYATPWYGKPFVRADYDQSVRGLSNFAAMQAHLGPLLILSGKGDRQAHWKMSRSLFEAAVSTQKQFVLDPKADHGGVLATPEAESAYRALLQQVRAAL